jgi:hypothetical protein
MGGWFVTGVCQEFVPISPDLWLAVNPKCLAIGMLNATTNSTAA